MTQLCNVLLGSMTNRKNRKNSVSTILKAPAKRATLACLFLLFLTSSLTTPVFSAFQENLWGARPASIGGAFTALADDANAPAYNPSGISFIPESELTVMYAQLYNGLNFFVGDEGETSRLGLGYFSYVPKIKDKEYGSYAISWANFIASNLYREDTFSLTWADSYQFEHLRSRPILAYGTNIKFLRRSFSTDQRTANDPVFSSGRNSNAFAADLGFLYRPNLDLLPGLKIGLAAQNLNEPDVGLAASDRVPARYSLGVAYQDIRFRYFSPTIDISKRGDRSLVSAGVEGWFARNTISLRFGGNKDQLGGGLGYQLRLFRSVLIRIDYALLWPLNIEGTNGSHRFSLTTNF